MVTVTRSVPHNHRQPVEEDQFSSSIEKTIYVALSTFVSLGAFFALPFPFGAMLGSFAGVITLLLASIPVKNTKPLIEARASRTAMSAHLEDARNFSAREASREQNSAGGKRPPPIDIPVNPFTDAKEISRYNPTAPTSLMVPYDATPRSEPGASSSDWFEIPLNHQAATQKTSRKRADSGIPTLHRARLAAAAAAPSPQRRRSYTRELSRAASTTAQRAASVASTTAARAASVIGDWLSVPGSDREPSPQSACSDEPSRRRSSSSFLGSMLTAAEPAAARRESVHSGDVLSSSIKHKT